MKPEQIQRGREEAIRKHDAEQLRREQDNNEYFVKRTKIQPFEELAQANLSIHGRAERIVHLIPSSQRACYQEDQQAIEGPWIVLERGDDSGEGWVVGRITKRNEEHKLYVFETLFTNVTHVERVKNNPFFPNIYRSSEITERSHWTTDRLDVYRDQIMKRAFAKTSVGFNPILAWKRRRYYDEVVAHNQSLEGTLDIFEAAIIDPDLNPHLAEWVKSANFGEQAGQAA